MEIGVPCRIYELRCTVKEARERVLARTAALPPGTLEITGATFDDLLLRFEPLGVDEDHILVETSAEPAGNL